MCFLLPLFVLTFNNIFDTGGDSIHYILFKSSISRFFFFLMALVYSNLDVVLGRIQYMLVELAIKGFLLTVLSRDLTSKGTGNTLNKCLKHCLVHSFACSYAMRSAETAFLSVAWPDWNLLLPPAMHGDFRHVVVVVIAPGSFLNHAFVSVCEGCGCAVCTGTCMESVLLQ